MLHRQPGRIKHWRAEACRSTRTGPPVRRARRGAGGRAPRPRRRRRRPPARPRPGWHCRPGTGLAGCPGWRWPRSTRHRHCTCANRPTLPAAPDRNDQTDRSGQPDRPRHPPPARHAPGGWGRGALGRRTPGCHARGDPQRQRGLRRQPRQRHGWVRTSPSWRPQQRERAPPAPTARSAGIASFSAPGDSTPSPKPRHRAARRPAGAVKPAHGVTDAARPGCGCRACRPRSGPPPRARPARARSTRASCSGARPRWPC